MSKHNGKRTLKTVFTMSRPAFIATVLTLVVLFISLVGGVTYAAYTNSRHAQRTIATYDSTGDRFSSNHLASLYTWQNVKTLYVTYDAITPANTPDPSTVVTVCNYQQGKQTLPFDDRIDYSLLVRLVKFEDNGINDNEKYVPVDASYMTANSLNDYTVSIRHNNQTVTLGSATELSHTYTGTLDAGVTDSDAYTLTMSANFALNPQNLYLQMIAAPSENPELPVLRGIFKAELRSQGANNRWQGEFTDNTSSSPADYAAFNYTISGVGSGTYTLSWDGTKIKPSDYSLITLLSIDGATQDGNSITFPVNSDVNMRYDLQFHKVNITTETWQQMNTTVVTGSFR